MSDYTIKRPLGDRGQSILATEPEHGPTAIFKDWSGEARQGGRRRATLRRARSKGERSIEWFSVRLRELALKRSTAIAEAEERFATDLEELTALAERGVDEPIEVDPYIDADGDELLATLAAGGTLP